jgi:hypothetical protein
MKVSGHHSEWTETGFHGPVEATLSVIGGVEGGEGGFQNYREFEHLFRNGSQQGWRYGFSAQRASDSNSQGHRPW